MKESKNNTGVSKVWGAVIGLAVVGTLLLYGAAILVVIGTLWVTFIVLKKMFWG